MSGNNSNTKLSVKPAGSRPLLPRENYGEEAKNGAAPPASSSSDDQNTPLSTQYDVVDTKSDVEEKKEPKEKISGEKLMGKLKQFSSESWGGAGKIIFGAIIIAVLAGFSFFFNLLPMFEDINRTDSDDKSHRGIASTLNTNSPLAGNSGLFFHSMTAGLFVLGSASALALSFAANKDAIFVSILGTLVLSFVYHLSVLSVIALNTFWYWAWTGTIIVLGVILAGLGIYSLNNSYKAAKDAVEKNKGVDDPAEEKSDDEKKDDDKKDDDKKDDEKIAPAEEKPVLYSEEDLANISSRRTISMVLGFVSLASGIGLVYAHYDMSKLIKSQDDKTVTPVPTTSA